jgi:antitoxin component YwqK of YwqJK toxin-antitoxin module
MGYRQIVLNFILVILSTGLFSQDAALNKYDAAGKKTGVWETYYQNGKVKSHGTFKDGHPVGELLKYYPGGILQATMKFDEAGRTSYVILYYEAGYPAAEGKFIDQKKDSVWNYFSAYDKRKAVSESYKMGKKDGVSFKFYPDGKISEYLEWQEDLKHGKWEQYYENGQVRLTGVYNTGMQNGIFISYNADSSLSISGSYVNDVMDGVWTYYNETGELDLTVEYKNGKMLPNPEMERRNEEFSKKMKDAVGKFDETEMEEFK